MLLVCYVMLYFVLFCYVIFCFVLLCYVMNITFCDMLFWCKDEFDLHENKRVGGKHFHMSDSA